MMNTKINTKVYNENTSNSGIKKGDDAQNLSPQQLKEIMGDKDLGTFLNEIADKNYVDPAKMRKPQGKMDKDAFLKLMLTQLKYQDPMNPLESHEMAAQLAQFSQLEQLSNIDNSVQALTKAQNPMVNYQALNFMGRTISADTEKIIRGKGDTSHDLRFTLPAEAKSAKITIVDEAGQVAKIINVSNLNKGENNVTWNGTKEDGYPAFAGNYSFKVEAESDKGGKFLGQTSFTGLVTGLNYSPEGPVLMIGNQKVKLSDVKKIEDENAKFVQSMNEQRPQVQEQAAAPGAEEKPRGNIDRVPMAGDLKDRLARETT